MNDAFWLDDFFIALKKIGISHSVFCALILYLWIGKRDPDFIDLAFTKRMFNEFDLCPKKGHIIYIFFQCRLCPSPKTGAFDINPDKVFVLVTFGKGNAILTFSTAQF